MKTSLRLITGSNSKSGTSFITSIISKQIARFLTGFLFLAGFSLQASAQTITNVTVSPNPVCAGSVITVTFDVTNGASGFYFTNATSYQAYLSDAAGTVFTGSVGSAFTVTASYSTTNNGITSGLTQNITIPASTVSGNNYKISIGSTNPGFVGTTGANASSVFTINAQVTPSVSIASNAAGNTICAGTNVTFTATPTNGGSTPTYQWQLNGLYISGQTGSTYSTSGLTNGQVITVAMTSNALCASTSSVTSNPIATTVNGIPTITGTTPGSVCGSGTTTLGATASAGVVNWYAAASGGSSLFTGTSFTTPGISTTTTYYVDATNNGCTTGTRTPVVATVNTVPTIATTTPGSVCGTGAVILGATASTGVVNWYAAASGGLSLFTGTSFTTPSISTTTTYYVDATSTGCTTGTRTAVVATVNLIPTITTTTPGSICVSGTVTLGATASAGLVNWYAASSGGSSLFTGISYTTPSISTTTTYYVDATNNGCTTGTRTAVVATVNANPTIATTTPGSVCVSGTVILGATASAGVVNWYAASNGGSILFTGTSFTTPSISTTTTYYVDATNNGCITATRTAVVATVNTAPAIATITSGSVCGTGTVTLGATASAGAVNWYAALTGGSSLFTGTSFTTPSISTTTTYYVDAMANGCTTSSRTSIVATVKAIPTITGTTPASRCSAGTVTLGATASAGTINWYAAATGGPSLGTGTTFTTPSISTTTTYYVDATLNGCTTASRTSVVASENDIPTITGTTPASRCNNGSVTLNATSSAGTINWYSAPIGGASLATGTSYSPTISATTTYYVDATIGGCTTGSRTAVTATKWVGVPTTGSGNNTASKPSITPSPSICPPKSGLIITIPSNMINGDTYVWNLPPGFTITAGANTNQITVEVLGPGASLGNQNITVTAYNACGNSILSQPLVVSVNSFAAVNIGSDFSSCFGTSPTLTNVLSGNATDVTWTIVSGTGSISGGPYPATFIYTPITSGSAVLKATTNTPTGGGCPNLPGTAQITITVNQPSVAPTSLNVSTSTICSGSNTTLTQTGGSLGTGASWKWYTNNTFTTLAGTGSGPTASLTVNPTTTTTYYLRAESSTGAPCTANVAGPAAGVTVTVNQSSVAPTSLTASSSAICNPGSSTLTQTGGSLGTGATWRWYSDNTYTTFVAAGTSATASLSVSPTITTTYYLRAESSTGAPCTANVAGPVAGITVTVNQPSVAPTGLSVSTATICNGSSTTLTQTGGSLGTGATWRWYSDNTYTTFVAAGTGVTASLSVSPIVTTTYYLRAESSAGAPCTANVAGPVGGITVTVNQPSVGPTGLNVSTSTICNGSSTTLTQTGGSLGTGATWRWYSDNGYTTFIAVGTGATASLSVSPTVTTTYYLRAESSTGTPCTSNVAGPAAGVTVTVNQPSVAPTSLSVSTATICNGSSTTLTQNGGNLGTGASWKWYSDNTYTTLVGTGAGATASLSLSPTATTTYYLRAESSTGAPCTANVAGPIAGVTVTVNQPILINTQPAASQSVCSSFPVSFSVAATGVNLTYQWYKDGVPLSNTAPYSGVTTVTLNISQAAVAQTGTYAVIISAAPCTPVTSANAQLIVNQDITINTQPIPETVCEGSNVTFSIVATGNINSYVWRKNGIPVSGGNYSGFNTATLTITGALVANAGNYDAVISGTGGSCTQVVSSPALLTVNTLPVITTQPSTSSQSVCLNGTSTALSVTATGTSLTYQWFSNTTNSNSGGTSLGAGAQSTNYTPLTTTAGTLYYYVIVSGTCTPPATSAVSGAVTINSAPAITAQPSIASQSVCLNGTSTALSVTATGASLTYQWFSNTTNSNSGGTSLGAGAQSTSYTPLTTTAGTLYYYVIVSGTCTPPATSAVSGSVTINSAPAITAQPSIASQSVCLNGTSTALSVTATGTSLTYQWFSNTTNSNSGGTSLGAGAQSTSYTPLTTTAGTLYYYVIVSGTCTPPATSAVSGAVTINSAPAITAQPSTASQSVCLNGTSTALSVTATGASLTYQWFSNTTNSNSGGTSLGAGAQSTSYTPLTTMAGTLYYYVIVSGTCTPPVTSAVSGAVGVAPLSVGGTLFAALKLECIGANNATITLSGNTGTVLRWEQSTDFGSTWTTVLVTNSLTYTYTNLIQTTFFRTVVQSGICSSAKSAIAQVIVNPAFVSTITASSLTTCVNVPVTLTASGYTSSGLVITGGDFQNANPTGWNGANASGNSGSNNFGWAETNAGTYNTQDYNSPGKFMIVTGTGAPGNSSLTSPVFSLVGLSSAYLALNQAYNLLAGASAQIQISADGGSTYTTLQTYTGSGTAPGLIYGPTNGLHATEYFNLNLYLGRTNLMLRFLYNGNTGSDWAVDNIFVTNTNDGSNPTGAGILNTLTYTWSSSAAAISSTTGNPITFTPASFGTGSATISLSTQAATCAATNSLSVTITINDLPAITVQPSAITQTVCPGGAASLSVGATGTNITYQWYSNTIASNTGGTLINGANSSNYTPGTTTPGTLYYYVIVSGTCTPAVKSNVSGAIIVNAKPAITVQPSAAVQTVCVGGSASLSVTATGTSLTYQWYSNTTASNAGGALISSATASSYSPITTSVGTLYYYVIVTGTCTPAVTSTISGAIIVNAPILITTQPTTSNFCLGGNSSITIVVSGTSPAYQWQVGSSSTGPWTDLTNIVPYSGVNTATLNFTNPSVLLSANYYRVMLSGPPPCSSSAQSNAVTLQISNVWTGNNGTDWNDGTNWSDRNVPSITCQHVYIPNTTNKPILSGSTNPITDLDILAGGKLTITGSGVLQIGGVISKDPAGIFDAANGSLDFNGSVAQSFSGNLFVSNTLKNLTASNTSGTGLSVTGAGVPLNITGVLSFGIVSGATLNTGNNIVLISTALGTARVADITNGTNNNTGNTFNGNVTVERYYPPLRAWRLVTSPLSNTGNIFDSWQNSGVYVAGKGMFVTGPNPTGTGGNGLDLSSQNNYSMKTWDATGAKYLNIGDTKSQLLSSNTSTAASIGYFTFVRGDRNRNPDNTAIPNTNPTTLSSKGKLMTGTQTFPVNVADGGYELIGNPYASPVDFDKLTATNLVRRFYVWDPHINLVGGYVVMEDLGGTHTYTGTPDNSNGLPNNFIQSSEAFFVQKSNLGTPATISFNEPNKSGINNLNMFRPMNPKNQAQSLTTNLYTLNNDRTTKIVDGNLAEFSDNFHAETDLQDALKFGNVNETLGLLNGTTLLAVNRRPSLTKADTIFYKFSKARQLKYQFEFAATNLEQDNLAGFAEDKFLNTATPLNMTGTTKLDFEVTSTVGSAAADRFRIVFKPSVVYTSLTATVLNSDIGVEWNVANEQNIKEYEIERSTDGVHFAKVATRASSGNSATAVGYNWLDVAPALGYYYYKIRSISNNNVIGYSNIAKVKINKSTPAIYVFPNPVTENTIHLQMNGMAKGVYHVNLMNDIGQVVSTNWIGHLGGTATETMQPTNKLLSGVYQLQVTAPDKKTTMIKVIVQ